MSNETQQKQGFEIHPPGWELESWQRTHAQLLKSVADAQAKLLAGLNETCDKVESISRNLGLAEKRLTDRLDRMDRDLRVLIGQTQEEVRNSHGSLNGRLDEIRAELLAKPRRQVERIQPKRIVKRATSKEKRRA